MNQPTPEISPADVERVVRRDFSEQEVADVLRTLEEYGTESFHREKERVQLAVLKLARGNCEKLRYEIECAKCDYRDTLGPAEYPAYTKAIFRIDKLPQEERKRLIDSDWKQYQEWLNK